jgi:hypothetical protein
MTTDDEARKERIARRAQEAAMVNDTPQDEEVVDWSQHSTVPGLEHLGRAIVDANGIPSGSPANYENERGATGVPVITPEGVADIVSQINESFAKQ